jgi:hypothetical protein
VQIKRTINPSLQVSDDRDHSVSILRALVVSWYHQVYSVQRAQGFKGIVNLICGLDVKGWENW